ncbi:pilus assembly protein [Thermodesulfovibrio hydrogeniphilus]
MKRLLLFIIIVLTLFLIKDTQTVESIDMGPYCHVPPGVGEIAAPNVLLVIDVSGSMGWRAYGTYNEDEEGYFIPDKVYEYYYDSQAKKRYWKEIESSEIPESCPNTAADIDRSKKYKGSCLNFLFMRRVDLVRWALTGGKPDSCDSNNLHQCDPELYPNPQLSCYSDGCILESYSGEKVKVPWSRITGSEGGLLFQVKNYELKPRFGVMFYSGDGVRGNKAYIGDFTSSANYDGVNPYKNTITLINYESPSGATPTGPAMWDAYNYFAQKNPQYGGFNPQSGQGDVWKNPLYQCFDENGDGNCQGNELKPVPCAKNFVILLTDGQWNTPSCSGEVSDPVYPAYKMHKEGFTNPVGRGTYYVESVYGIGLWLGGTGERSLKNIAMYGSFSISKTWPDNLTGYPSNSCTMDDCGSGSGSGCTPLPSSSPDWDKDGDGQPDTFASASDAKEIKNALSNAISSILSKSSSGATVATLSSRGGISSVILQPYYYPKVPDTEVQWIGMLRAFWVDLTGNLREDSIVNKILDLASGSFDRIIQFFVDTTGDTRIARLQDYSTCTAYDTVSINGAISLFNSGCQLTDVNASSRVIKFNNNGTITDLTTSQSATLQTIWNKIDSSIDTTKAGCIIRYLRGENLSNDNTCKNIDYIKRPRELNVNQFCGSNVTKTWKLGDIIHSTPSVSSDKPLNFYHLRYGDVTYRSYIQTTTYKNRPSIAYVGANDGMLHAFRVGTIIINQSDPEHPAKLQNAPNDTGQDKIGREEWAFIPKNALPYLLWYGHYDYCHIPTVDYRTLIFDASIQDSATSSKTPSSWRTILVGVMGFGGKKIDLGTGGIYSSSIFALDLTDWLNGTATYPTLLWEATLPDNTLTLSFPSIVRLGDKNNNGEWYVVIGTGPTGPEGATFANSGKVYFYDLRTGNMVKSLTINTSSASLAVGDIYNVDVDDDYQDDVIYFGVYGKTSNNYVWGNFYRLSLRSGNSYKSISSLHDNDIQLAVNLSTFKTGNHQPPVFAAPAFTLDESNNLWVFFGTGKFLNNDDKSIPYTNYLIGYKDPFWNSSGSAFEKGQLENVRDILSDTTIPYLTETECICDTSGCSNRSITYNKIQLQGNVTVTHGWYYSLSGEAIISQPFLYGEMVNSLVFVPPGEICEYSGKTRYIALHYKLLYEPNYTIVIDQIIGSGVPPLGQPFQALPSGRLIVQTSAGTIIKLPTPTFLAQGKFVTWIEK